MIQPGTYKAKAIKETVQFGESERGNLQVFIDLDIKDPSTGNSLGSMTTFLFFTEGAKTYSYERLKALGWKGQGPEDIGNLDGIDANEVDVRVTQPEQYRDADGTTKTGNSKVEIVTGGGGVKMGKTLDTATFAARLRALGGGTAPPF